MFFFIFFYVLIIGEKHSTTHWAQEKCTVLMNKYAHTKLVNWKKMKCVQDSGSSQFFLSIFLKLKIFKLLSINILLPLNLSALINIYYNRYGQGFGILFRSVES